jgi:ankyrin repeat protein
MPNKQGKQKGKATANTGADPNRYNRALLSACDDANVESMQAAIAAGADVNYSPGGGFTPLIVAADKGFDKCVAVLLSARANKEAKQLQGGTALISASIKGHYKCVALLLNAGANHGGKTNLGHTALIYAVEHGRDKCVKLLLTAGAEMDELHADGRGLPLHMAAKHGHVTCVEHLLNARCDVNALSSDGASALVIAVCKNDIDCVRRLVRAVADVTIQNQGHSLDGVAAAASRCTSDRSAMKLALRNVTAGDIHFAMHHACLNGVLSAPNDMVMSVKSALTAGGDVNHLHTDDQTCLMAAAFGGHVECVEHVVKQAGCNVNAIRSDGASALLLAVQQNHVACVRALLRAGADGGGRSLADIAAGVNVSVAMQATLRCWPAVPHALGVAVTSEKEHKEASTPAVHSEHRFRDVTNASYSISAAEDGSVYSPFFIGAGPDKEICVLLPLSEVGKMVMPCDLKADLRRMTTSQTSTSASSSASTSLST